VFSLQISIYRASGTNEIKSATISSRFWMESAEFDRMDEEWSISMKKVKLDDISGDKKKSF
jgi:hypothetical protein